MRVVSKAEFDAFIDAYPRKLESDVWMMPDPPCLIYYDWTLGDGFDAMVAVVQLNEDRDGTPNVYKVWP